MGLLVVAEKVQMAKTGKVLNKMLWKCNGLGQCAICEFLVIVIYRVGSRTSLKQRVYSSTLYVMIRFTVDAISQ